MPHFADIGKNAKELIMGNPKSGAFSFDPKLSFASTTSSGVAFAVTGVKKADKVDGTLKITYATAKYSGDATIDPAGKVTLNASLADALKAAGVPGVKLGVSCALPDVNSAKLNVEYGPCKEFSMKSSMALTSAPVVDMSAACLYQGVLVGGEVAYDTKSSAVMKYNVAVGYNAADYQVAAFLTDKGKNIKLSYAHSVSSSTTVGAEVAKPVDGGSATFTLGYAKKLASGALAKVKLDNSGTLSTMYETKLTTGEKVAGSLQLNATDLSKAPKYGFALDLC